MSQDPFQFSPQPQGAGPQGFGPPQGNPYPAPTPSGDGSTMKIVLIILGVILVLGVLICGVLAALLIPAVSAARDAAKRMQDQNNLKQIALAVHNYEATYKKMPAPFAINSKGEKVWSWSVSLLPFCESSSTYSQIDFTNMQPWDAPGNSVLQGPAPFYLQSIQANLPPGSREANVFIISAPTKVQRGNPVFIDGTHTNFADVHDGLSNTILAIMLVKHTAPWAAPQTLTADEAYQLIQNEDKYFQVAICDGSVISLPVTIDKATFDAMVTRDGGESVIVPSYP